MDAATRYGAIAQYLDTHNKSKKPTKCLLVTKGRTAEELALLYHQVKFEHIGENYLQEALEKRQALAHLPLIWHFIGRIQSNKAKKIAQHFDWVQSVATAEVASILSQAREGMAQPLQVCIQLNIDCSPSKAGVQESALVDLITHVAALPHLRLRGLMVMPSHLPDTNARMEVFAKARGIFEKYREVGVEWDTLSMGMSGDYQEAVAQGSTMIRIGQGILGPRE